MFRRGPAIALSTLLGVGAIAVAPLAHAVDGGTAKDKDPCSGASTVKLKVEPLGNDRLDVTGVVYSNGDDLWDWVFRHDGDVSADGTARADGDADGKSFRINRDMVDFSGERDYIVFRAQNRTDGEVCRAELNY